MLLGIPVLGAMVASRLREPDGLEGWRTLETAESAYQAIRVVEGVGDGPRMRRMQVNEGLDSFQSVWQPEPGLLPDGYYYNLFALPMRWAPRQETWSVFVAGLGAGTAWRVLEGVAPEGMRMRLAGAEIDPKIVSLGERWFDLPGSDDTHLVLAGWDARAAMRGLAAEERLFDEIIVDAYANQMEIPAHLCSVEFFREARSRLAPRGWLAVNVGGFGLDDPVVRGVGKTIASAFERRVLGVRVPFSRNCVIFARRDAEPPEPGSPAWIPEGEPQAARLAALAIEGACRWFEPDGAAELTDDRNPIDTLQWESVRRGKQAWADGP
jgi:spermidine synthase